MTALRGRPFAALLRAVNLTGYNRVPMAELRDVCATLGFSNCRTLLQSGNVVFTAEERPGIIEKHLDAAVEKRFGFRADVFVRTPDELRTVMDANPFTPQAASDPSRLLVMFLRDTPDTACVRALSESVPGAESVSVSGRHAYLFFPDGQGRSRLSTSLIERKLCTRGTARNWNTVRKLASMLQDL